MSPPEDDLISGLQTLLINASSKSARHQPGTRPPVPHKAPSKVKPSSISKGIPLKSSIGTAHLASLLADNKVPLYAKSGSDYKGYINKIHRWLPDDSEDKFQTPNDTLSSTYSVSKRKILVQRALIDRGANDTVGGSDCTWIIKKIESLRELIYNSPRISTQIILCNSTRNTLQED